jgi:ABC-type Fe3+/spermidine/putrescine transport system ATPase subunit
VAGVALSVEGPDGVAAFVIRPEYVRIGSGGAFAARVLDTAYTGSHVRVSLDAGGQALEALVEPGTAPAAGTTVRVDLPEGRLWRLADAGA